MRMKWASFCLLAVALSSLADAQSYKPAQPPPPVVWPQLPAPPVPAPPAPPPQDPKVSPIPKQHWRTLSAPPPPPPQAPQVSQGPKQHWPPTPPQFPQVPQNPKQHWQPPAAVPPRYTPPKQKSQTPALPNYRPQATQTQKDTKLPPIRDPTPLFQSCDVAASYKIKCGLPGITAPACQAINCCHDGQMCYYGKAVTVQCTKDGQFIVVVARDATLPNIVIESVSMLGGGPGCTPVGITSAFAVYQFPVTACGTIMTELPGEVVYENRMASSYTVDVGDRGTITRDTTYELLFQCRYIGTSVEALVIEVNLVPPPSPVAALGPIRVVLDLGNGQCVHKGCREEDVAFSSFYVEADYPLVKVLRDPIYVEVKLLERTDPSLVLTLGYCWTTTTPNPYSLPQWNLLADGCPYSNDRYQTAVVPVSGVPLASHYKRFVFKMFTFVDQATLVPLREKLYIHCEASVCQPNPGYSCEPSCSLNTIPNIKKNKKRRDAGQATYRESPSTALVSSMEVVFTSQDQSS